MNRQRFARQETNRQRSGSHDDGDWSRWVISPPTANLVVPCNETKTLNLQSVRPGVDQVPGAPPEQSARQTTTLEIRSHMTRRSADNRMIDQPRQVRRYCVTHFVQQVVHGPPKTAGRRARKHRKSGATQMALIAGSGTADAEGMDQLRARGGDGWRRVLAAVRSVPTGGVSPQKMTTKLVSDNQPLMAMADRGGEKSKPCRAHKQAGANQHPDTMLNRGSCGVGGAGRRYSCATGLDP